MMLNRQNRPVRTLVTATALMTCAQAAFTLQAAGQAIGNETPGKTLAATSAGAALAHAKDLVAQGQLIRARDVLIPLSAASSTLTDSERSQLSTQLASLDRAIRAADQNDITLQKGELALEQGDLRSAARHAGNVVTKGSAEQKAKAQSLQTRVVSAQSDAAKSVDSMLTQARDHFAAGRAAESKATLEAIFRTGVELSASQSRIVDDMQTRIIELEQTRGIINTRVAAGMMQPGVVNRDPQPAPAAQPTPAPAPAPAPAPEATPAPAAAPAAQPVSEATDVVAAARQAEAMNLLAEADKAYNERRFNEAQTKYNRLLSIHRDHLSADQTATINNRLAEIKLQMGAGGADALGQLAADRSLAKQQKLAEFQNELGLAKQALESGDAERAQDYLARAQLTLSSGRNLFAESEYQGYVTQVNDRKADLENRRLELAKKQAEDQDRQRAADAAKANAARASEKDAKIRESIDRVRALQVERRYEEALQVVDQILFLDPNNASGLLLKDVLTESKIYSEFQKADQERWVKAGKLGVENRQALIPPNDIMNFPSDWPAISSRRGEPITLAEPAETRQALALLKSKRVPVNFNENSLGDVIAFLQTVTQLNVDVDWPSLEAVSINRETPVTLNLTQVPVETVLNRVLEKVSSDDQNAAGWAIEDGVLRIASKDAINRNKILVIYDVRDLTIEIRDFNNAPRLDITQTSGGNSGSGQSPFRGGNTGGNNTDAVRTLEERTNDLLKIITETVDTTGWRENGGNTGFIQQLRGNLIITQTPKNHRAIASLLGKLREVRSLQINCETRFLLVNQNFYERIGFDLDIYFNTGQLKDPARQPLFSADPTLRGQDFFNANGGVARNVTGGLLPVLDTNGAITGWARTTQGYWNTGQWSPIGAQSGSNAIVSNLITSQDSKFAAAVGQTPALGIAGSFMDDIQVDFLLQATQADKRTVSLTAPRLTFTNGQRANISVSNDLTYVQDLQVVTSSSAAAFDPTPGLLTTGSGLDVTGTISSDRRFVTLEVQTSISQLVRIRSVPTTAVVGAELVNSAQSGQASAEYPEINRTSINTTVTVPDQGTVLLGGQRLVTEVDVESGVPVLSKIPIISRFFTNTAKAKDESTLLILMKPTILIQNEEEEKNFPGLMDAIKTGASANN
ncbi:MAG: hypothetical protein SFY96_00055 [Planctomycetota bacterium]|nr:hypothetical protein [Planctomycetota bacterium]